MADEAAGKQTHLKALGYFNSVLLTALTGLLTWQQVELGKYRTNGEEERKQLLDYALDARKEAKAARENAKAAKDVAESTKATVESTKKTVENTEKVAQQTKKAVEGMDP